MVTIGASMMCAHQGRLLEELIELDRAGIDTFHFDIMDGHFVPNFTMGPDIVRELRPYTKRPFDIHLMVEDPERYVDMFADAGADAISVHAEATRHLQKLLARIRDRGLKAGVALNPSTPVHALDYVLDVCDYVCVMTVNPGFSGQRFIPEMFMKITDVKRLLEYKGAVCDIQVDGNIGAATIPGVLQRGATMLVLGTSALFVQDMSRADAVSSIRELIRKFTAVVPVFGEDSTGYTKAGDVNP
ncbi:MAG: ribulose-phosphate 3-epimerase [Alicyclobacillus sp.]|nr:ribulose-phosphate 3-epimerase [Alicyclobacillus sp.]